MAVTRQPTYFLCHGSPNWLVEPTAPGPSFLKSLGKKILASLSPPSCLVVISAHWETDREIRVTTRENHGKLLYDYYGFPAEYYDIEYPAKGHPEIAEKAKGLLKAKGFAVKDEVARGLDHGVFTPLIYMFPKQEIPVVVVSLPVTNDPNNYYKLGEALRPLRDEGALIIGGGMITHNLNEFRNQMRSGRIPAPSSTSSETWATEFAKAVEDALTISSNEVERKKAILKTFNHQYYSKSHPSPEHYAPVLVAAAAAGDDKASKIHSSWSMGVFTEDSYMFGSAKEE
ncbi:hypothetical protein HDU67_005500 [Dinochytrium kinnereticum]|nr:hypothetical protein HDU67_005500 [Dinochytrium kinnereticum]